MRLPCKQVKAGALPAASTNVRQTGSTLPCKRRVDAKATLFRTEGCNRQLPRPVNLWKQPGKAGAKGIRISSVEYADKTCGSSRGRCNAACFHHFTTSPLRHLHAADGFSQAVGSPQRLEQALSCEKVPEGVDHCGRLGDVDLFLTTLNGGDFHYDVVNAHTL